MALEHEVTTTLPSYGQQHADGRPNELKLILNLKTFHNPVFIMEQGPATTG